LIYNLGQFLRDSLPTETIYINQRKATDLQGFIPDRNIFIRETGGVEAPDTNLRRQSAQILTMDIDGPKARALAYLVYNLLQSKWGLVLPQITVDSIVFTEIETAQISSVQIPSSMGSDEEGRSVYVFNIIVIWEV
jgi:hypothetical protein